MFFNRRLSIREISQSCCMHSHIYEHVQRSIGDRALQENYFWQTLDYNFCMENNQIISPMLSVSFVSLFFDKLNKS